MNGHFCVEWLWHNQGNNNCGENFAKMWLKIALKAFPMIYKKCILAKRRKHFKNSEIQTITIISPFLPRFFFVFGNTLSQFLMYYWKFMQESSVYQL